ncbi:MAG: bifunctional [glutamate--ammonia ligase]-adenylyl-L-tyrosine phosphorylase/[glutamate--ammonia-ligase] adenylyltransferase [Pseudomonadales bacterium]|nr:bifunctional [glutamate--ammonia ligase]-adenylyl-L-tyrosine phosphorylase/[glutamate--ammonia-ligase] adenylyltransferase [Pseudomonadales bacterium]
MRVFSLSEFAASTAQRHEDWLVDALRRGRFDKPASAADLAAALTEQLDAVTDMAGLQCALRSVRQRHQLWLVWRHVLGLAPLEETTHVCSGMADLLIDAALERVYAWNCERRGVPLGADSGRPQQLVVLALGKLGAEELNLSSDVDLVFTYPEAGSTESGETNQQFFVRVGQQLIQALDALTVDGFVFRVDMRLRPYGASGPLAVDFANLENYYATQGRDWERYALMKARACAGDIAEGTGLLADLRPFVFRRYLDFGAIDALRDMKARLIAERHQSEDVKLGPGGIRDVEFCVQMHQMIWGGREHVLQSPRLLEVLPALGSLGLLEAPKVDALLAGYRMLRDTEHSLQAEADRQTQQLPAAPESRLRLAVSRGFADYAGFLAALDRHRVEIQRVFEDLLGEQPEGEDEATALWRAPTDAARLQRFGFKEIEASSALLLGLVSARDRPAVSENARTRLNRLMPLLLQHLRESAGEGPSSDLILERVTPILRAVLRRSAYLSLLAENPNTLRHLLNLVGTSLWLAQQLAEHPIFFDALLDGRQLSVVPDRATLSASLAEDLKAAGEDEERALNVLREFKSHHVFSVALAEVRGTLPLMKVSDALSFLAEAVLDAALRMAWDANLERFPEYAQPRPFIIVGYGKLGGIELGPGSDLDLVFVHDLPEGAGPFLQRLVRRLLHVLTAPTYSGALYEIDTRLRPSGGAGTMVSSLSAFADYQDKRAWTWEQQALVRARPVAGDAALAKRFAALRREILGLERDRDTLRDEILKMRERISEHLLEDEDADLKRGAGGIVDIEFMVQYLVLAWAHQHPSLTEFTDNVRILDAVERLELLPSGAAGRLRKAYIALRAEWHRSVLDIPDRERASLTLATYRDEVRTIWTLVFGEQTTA